MTLNVRNSSSTKPTRGIVPTKPGPIPPGDLKLGSKGKRVADLQRELAAAGFSPGAVDGVFGPKTQAAVMAFQRAHRLVPDGICGPKTWAALGGDRFEHHKKQPPPGASRLFGNDTSHWQSDSTFQQSIAGKPFTMIKATQGNGEVDPSFRQRWNELGQKIASGQMKLRVAYAVIDRNSSGASQAQHFLNTLGVHGPLKPGTRLAIDWESSTNASTTQLRDFGEYVHKVTGIWPMVYCSASRMPTAHAVLPNCPRWEAAYGSGIGIHDVPFVQYSDGNGGLDADLFNGTMKQLEKFAGW